MPKRRACGSSAASGVAPLTCAIQGPASDPAGDLGDRAVGDAEQNELGLVVVEEHAALGEARAHRGTDAAARAYDSDSLDHRWLQFRFRIPGSRRVAAPYLLRAAPRAARGPSASRRR